MLLTLMVGLIILPPEHLELLAESAIAALLSVSNIGFWSESGYFDAAAIYKPLLHTWSLGVEAQFYLVWPLLLGATRGLGLRGIAALLLGLSIVSLVAAQTLLTTAPDAVFFLAPFRFFEFAFGAALALIPPMSRGMKTRSFASLAGLVMILAAASIYDKSTHFPGLAALLPCFGAALVIYSGPGAWVNRQLAKQPFVYIGKISYSLYLVHWPIVVYYTYISGPPSSPVVVFGLFICVLALASAMYFWIEQPFRHPAENREETAFRIGGRLYLGGLGTGVLSVLVLAVLIDQNDGYPRRLPPDLFDLHNQVSEGRAARFRSIRRESCHFSDKTFGTYFSDFKTCLPRTRKNMIVVYGNSHAADIWAAVNRRFPDRNIVQLTGAGCGYGRNHKLGNPCASFIEAATKWVSQNRTDIDLLIYSQRGAHLLLDHSQANPGYGKPDPDALSGALSNVTTFSDLGLDTVYWGPRPEFHPSIEVVIGTSKTIDDVRHTYEALDMSPFLELDEKMRTAFAATSVSYLSATAAVCRPNCLFMTETRMPIIVDYGHWSPEGANYMLQLMLEEYPFFRRFLSAKE